VKRGQGKRECAACAASLYELRWPENKTGG
jgi:hypothetical protein